MKKELKITSPYIAASLVSMGIPLLKFDKKELLFIFEKTLDIQNVILLWEKNYTFFREEIAKEKATTKRKKVHIESPFSDLRSEYKKSTHGIIGAPRSKSQGVYRQ